MGDAVFLDEMTLKEFFSKLFYEDLGKLHTALLRIHEVDMLGEGMLKALWMKTNHEYMEGPF